MKTPLWIKRNGLSYAAHIAVNDAETVQLLVESHYGNGWDWTVWQTGPIGYRYRRGVQATLEQAKIQANEVACQMLWARTAAQAPSDAA